MTAHNKKLRVAGVPEHFNLPWHLALESGEFRHAGIELDFQNVPGGTGEMMRGLEKEKFDLAIVLPEGGVAAMLNGNPSRMVKVFVESPLIWGIHVSGNSQIHHVEEIKNQRYAISRFGSGSHLMAIVDAAERNWPTDNLQFEKIGNLQGARMALANGDADVFFWERFTTAPFVQSSEFRRVGERQTLWPAFVICARKSVLETSAAAVKTVLEVVNQSCTELMENPNACELISQRYQLRLPDVQDWYNKTKWSTDFKMPTAAIEKVKSYLNKLDIISDQSCTRDIWFDLDALS